ncbi:MAG: glycosyltransferase family 4 protein [Chitinophagaceae bacterium]
MEKIKVTFYHRKSRAIGNYSLEFMFADVRQRLDDKIDSKIFESTYESSGFFKRLYNVFEAAFNQNDVNHVTGDINYVGILFNKNKAIHTILDCIHLKSSTGLKHKILKYFWLHLPQKKSRFITAISTSTKNEILKYAPSCNPDKIVVIPVAISEQFVFVEKPFNKSKPTILQLGTAPNKNIENLILALKNIPCKLIIIGVKHLNLINLLESSGLDYNYLHGLSNEEILNHYQNADIVTLCSTYEGFGMPILEAQATGRAVITSNCFSMPEVGGNAAHYVNPLDIEEMKNGFLQIIENDTYRENLIALGLENVKRFNPTVIANMYFELYKKVHASNKTY